MRRWLCETLHRPQKFAALALLTFPSLRPARVARLLSMMQKKRAFGPRGPFLVWGFCCQGHSDLLELDDLRGALPRARSSRHNLVCGRVEGTRDHDAVMRIGSEAPGRRAHSLLRRGGHGRGRVTATSDRHARGGRSLPATGKQTKGSAGAFMGPAAARRRPAAAPSSPSATARSAACVPRRRSSSCAWRRARRRCVPRTTAPGRCPSGT